MQQAKATWEGIRRLHDPASGLPADRCRYTGAEEIVNLPRTKPTNIGFAMGAFISAERLEFVSESEANQGIQRILQSLGKLDTFNGLFYDWYHAETGKRLLDWRDSGDPLELFFSSIDNAWLAAALLVVQQAKPQFAEHAKAILSRMNFDRFFDPQAQEYWGGYKLVEITENEAGAGVVHFNGKKYKRVSTPHHYSRETISEVRIIPWVDAALCPDPQERIVILRRLLTHDHKIPDKLAGGAYFELAMPSMLVSEKYLQAMLAWGASLHHGHGQIYLNNHFGLSVVDNPANKNRYTEMGVCGSYPTTTVISWHAVALALCLRPREALHTMRYLRLMTGKNGNPDAMDLTTGACTPTQVFVNLANEFMGQAAYLTNHYVRGLFESHFTQNQLNFWSSLPLPNAYRTSSRFTQMPAFMKPHARTYISAPSAIL